MVNTIAVASPPEGFAFDPAPPGRILQEERLQPLPAVTPVSIGVTLEDIIKIGMSPRVLRAKCCLEQRNATPAAV